MIDEGFSDATGRRVTLRDVDDDNWGAVADVAPLDDQRDHVAALAARYLLLSMREDTWNSLAVCADDAVVGHVMWGRDDDGSHWIGGMLVDGGEQGRGVGRALMRTLTSWLAQREGCWAIRLSYHPDNVVAGRLYESLGFAPTGEVDSDELVAELAPSPGRQRARALTVPAAFVPTTGRDGSAAARPDHLAGTSRSGAAAGRCPPAW